MTEAHGNGRNGHHVGDLTICVKRDADGDMSWDFFPDTNDPVGLTVALMELFLSVVPQQPSFLLHVAHACQSQEHVGEVLEQLSKEAREHFAELLLKNEEATS